VEELLEARLADCGNATRMKTELPARAEYYRLSRARELRRQAARLERLHRGIPVLRAVWCSLFILIVFTGTIKSASLTFMLVFLLGGLLCGWGERSIPKRFAKLRADAVALENEHEARYGGLRREGLS
jgi:hypothetical protein